MNNILEKILANKSPEEFAREISEVRKIVGQDNEFDIPVEEVLGVNVVDYDITTTGDIEKIKVAKTPYSSSSDIFDQATSNDIPYYLAA